MKAPIEEINAFVDRNKEEMLLFWEQLVNRQAGSKEVDRVNRIMHFLKEHFEREGIDCRLVDSKGSANVLQQDGVEQGDGSGGSEILLHQLFGSASALLINKGKLFS